MQPPRVMRLIDVPSGSRARIVDVSGGLGLRGRLLQMGLVPGTPIEVIDTNRGPVIVRVRGVSMAIGRGIAHRIFVEPL